MSEDEDVKIPVGKIYKVAMKYSAFNRDDPEIWFKQFEAQFELSGITVDNTKYGHLVAALDAETIKCVRDLVLKPPSKDRYESLKSAIIERLCDSTRSKLNRLLSGLQLGDKKPSQLLREMQVLSSDQIHESVLLNLWLQRLPPTVEEVLSCMENCELDKIAASADKIMEIHRPSSIYDISSQSKSTTSVANHSLSARIDALTKRFDSWVLGERNSRDITRSANQGDRRSRSKSRSDNQVKNFPNCWYHHKFGSKAKNCVKPCKFNKTTEN